MFRLPASLFTRPRYVVPHEPLLGARWMLLIHEAVTAAFIILRERGFDLKNAGEVAITNELEKVLYNDLFNRHIIDGFDEENFRHVGRDRAFEDYSGKALDKQPDLVFQLKRENTAWDLRHDAVFAECKPVGRAHSLATNYCAIGDDHLGIKRFIIGHYAWVMEEAMLIGYVRDGFRIDPDLANCLAVESRHEKLGSPDAPHLVAPSEEGDATMNPLFRTNHLRLFTWKENGCKATSIALYHSWHDCN